MQRELILPEKSILQDYMALLNAFILQGGLNLYISLLSRITLSVNEPIVLVV